VSIAFLGTSEFAATVLNALVAANSSPRLVVSAPSRPKGRGLALVDPPVVVAAKNHGLEYFQPTRMNDPIAVERLRSIAPTLLVVVAYGQILSREVLELAPRGAVNLHGSILPKYRGPAPIARAIQNGDTETGVTLQYMVREVDAGDIVGIARMAIAPDDTHESLSSRMSVLAAELLLEHLPALLTGQSERTKQDPTAATRAPLLDKREGRVDWSLPASRIHDHVRAMTPWPGASTDWLTRNGPNRLVIRKTSVVPGTRGDAAPGTVVTTTGHLEIATGQGTLRIERLLRQGKSEMSAEEFLRGAKIETGDRFQ